MLATRRTFAIGSLSAIAALQIPTRAFAQASGGMGAALDSIRAYAEAHRRRYGLPGLTLALTTPDGLNTVLNFGLADADARAPIGSDTLFQIGSISKCFVGALLHQYASEGRFKLSDRLNALLPSVPLPEGNAVTVQHLLDHVAGLPGDAPAFPDGGLWTAYAPGAHWHYSNTGYDILGKLAEHVGGKPLAQLLRDRMFVPLGMRRSRGAITWADRPQYAQGYDAADMSAPWVWGTPLEPSAWVDVTFGAGSIGSTGDDMVLFLRSLANAAQGKGGLGLGPQQGLAFTRQAVPSDTPGMRYGNGLMHVANAGRSYLHHTGGMVSFSSSFHLDVANGIGAFASTNLSGFAGYRPRLLTRFAVDALTHAGAGRPLPSPPPFDTPLTNAASYVGRYSGPAGEFEIRAGSPLTIVAGGESAPLQSWGGETFRTLHPAFRFFSLLFERKGTTVSRAHWGPASFVRAGSGAALTASDPELAKLAGRFVNDSPWWGTNVIVERGGKLWLGTETPLTRISNNVWRVGEESWSPERAAFTDFIDGRPQTLIFSGEKFLRHDV
ncbi:serine hydrolase domain-containing protein [Sphingomonas hankyongi]|uniref:Beta-lactamase family protein n=1 Tax=Sphingomonas hankyongi TaxID=2908209 RepID=A0ABT0RZD2_9SPHN|nr:serine hydrolase domain-containing protein [Sphingomonas hankyongi]MCL6728947.1 beta-lactamase family protein [Sphingomonas hankyongi]